MKYAQHVSGKIVGGLMGMLSAPTKGCPIATFNYETENKLNGKLVGWSFTETLSDLHTGIREMAKKNERFRSLRN